MSGSRRDPATQWTPTWNAFDLLNLQSLNVEGCGFICLGNKVKCPGRCGKAIAKSNRDAAKNLVARLPGRSLHAAALQSDLVTIARSLLCPQSHKARIIEGVETRCHRDQAFRIVQRWQATIAQENQRSRAAFDRLQSGSSRDSRSSPESTTEHHHRPGDASPQTSDAFEYERESQAYSERQRRVAAAQAERVRQEQERRDEARRQSQCERAEREAEARARTERQERARREQERRREAEEEAQRRRGQQERPNAQTPNMDWELSWSSYRNRWSLTSALPQTATVQDLDRYFPWPLKDFRNFSLSSLARLASDAAFEREVKAFFQHMPETDRDSVSPSVARSRLRSLTKERKAWHPDKLLQSFPVQAVSEELIRLATRVTQVLNGLMSCVNI